MSDEKGKNGFSGLSSLASDVEETASDAKFRQARSEEREPQRESTRPTPRTSAAKTKPAPLERPEKDASALDKIAKQRAQLLAEMETRAKPWKSKITYEADVWVMFKDKLRISPDGVQWKGTKIPLEDISRVRWGGTPHSVNGIPSGTTYSIFVGGKVGETTIELRKKHIYSEFVDRLWKTVGVRLLTRMLEGLREGKRYRFGRAVITDNGVELERCLLFSANELVFCGWTDLVTDHGAGTFCIAKKDEKKVAVELPYQDMDNVRILEAAMRASRKNASLMLSDLLDEAH